MSEKTCPICGKPTNIYMGHARKDGLCREHGKLANTGELIKCPVCYNWKMYNEECATCKSEELEAAKKKQKSTFEKVTTPWTNPKKNEDKENVMEEISTNDLTCIACGKPSNGKHFCFKCYQKYKERTISIEIKNCTEFTVTDAYGNRDTKTANGLYVRSLSEKIIYDELFRRDIKCEYERTVTYKDEKGEIKELHPDFYLTDYKLYIEHWGYLDSRNKEYAETKAFKEKIYEQKGYKLAATTSQDIKDIQAAIERLLLENDINV